MTWRVGPTGPSLTDTVTLLETLSKSFTHNYCSATPVFSLVPMRLVGMDGIISCKVVCNVTNSVALNSFVRKI